MTTESVYSTPFGRVYKFGDRTYPSVSTILGGFKPNQQEWTNDYATLGTRAHYEILGLYKDQEEPDSYYVKFSKQEVNEKLDMAYEMWAEVDVGDVIDVELAVCDHEYEYGGRLDMITEIDGKLTVVDLKTGQYYNKYPLQIAAYCRAYGGDVEQALVVRLDLNLDRNPDRLADLIWYDREELDEHEAKFCEKAVQYHKDQRAYVESMT